MKNLTVSTNSSLVAADRSTVTMIARCILVLLLLLAIVSNSAAIVLVVRCRLSMKIKLYYIVMFATDQFILVFVYFMNLAVVSILHSVFEINWLIADLRLCKFHTYMFFASMFWTNYTVLLLSIERCIAAYKPFLIKRMRQMWTVLAIAAVFIGGALIHVWCYLEAAPIRRSGGYATMCMPNLSTLSGYTAYLIYVNLDSTVPSALTLSFNIASLVQIWKKYRQRKLMITLSAFSMSEAAATDPPNDPPPAQNLLANANSENRSCRRMWLTEVKQDVAQSRQLRVTLTCCICSLVQCGFYIFASVSWLAFATMYYKRLQFEDGVPPSGPLLILCIVGVMICAVSHGTKSMITLARNCDLLKRHLCHSKSRC